MTQLTQSTIVPFLADIFARRGHEEYLGEPVTMSQHMLQGAQFAQDAGESDTLIVATLLHDIGHFTSEFGSFQMNDTHDRHHEEAGAQILEQFFPKLVTDCVRYHVAAKRYLCATNPDYHDRLSEASVHSLKLQGGPMTVEEVTEMEQNPNVEDIVKMRLFDDAGKVTDMTTQPFEHYIPMIQRVIDTHMSEAI